MPLDLEMVSEYRVDQGGKIVDHRIVENRVNGRRSPTDVVSAWARGGGEDYGVAQQGAVSTFFDAVKWVQSVRGNR